MTLILSASELGSLTNMAATIDTIERAFLSLAAGAAHQPAPQSLHLPSSDARFLPMAALSDVDQLASVKLLADIPSNHDSGLPTQRSTILLSSQVTGETLAILDGRIPTRVRTAAASAVASKHLACPDSSVLGLVGAGALAVAHVEAMVEVLPIEKIIVWSRTESTLEKFRALTANHKLDIVFAGSVQEVVESAHVLCTLTPATEPLVFGKWFTPGLHVNAVGSRPRPEHREIDSEGVLNSRVFVDSLATAKEKSGNLIIPVSEGAYSFDRVEAELGEAIAGSSPGRTGRGDITLFNSVGIGLQDLAIGRLLYDRALEIGLGLRVDLAR